MLKLIKRQLIRGVTSLCGMRQYHLIPEWKFADYIFAKHLKVLFDKYDIKVVVDVGGNLGQYATFLREDVQFKGRILTIEPSSSHANALREKFTKDEKWSLVQCALGSEPGRGQLNVAKSPGLDSLLTARTDALPNYWKEGDVVSAEEVSLRTLDEVLSENSINPELVPVYLKIDTQGYDIQVLKGASRSLPGIRALQTEASVIPIYKDMPSHMETLNVLSNSRFTLSAMFPVTHDRASRIIEYDCVAVNDRYA